MYTKCSGDVMYQSDNWDFEDTSNTKKLNNKSNINIPMKPIIIGLIILIAFIAIVLLFKTDLDNNDVNTISYSSYEEMMVKSAKEYINKNNISSNKAIYIDILKLDIPERDNCSLTSGVIVEKESYKPYLSCENYTTKFNDNQYKYITLKGEEVMLLAKGIEYYEPGYKSNNKVEIKNNVGTEEGIYKVSYYVRRNNKLIETAYRTVIIIDNAVIKNLYPTINIFGPDQETIVVGTNYIDPGAYANDIKDHSLNNKINVESNLNINQEGEYLITYSVTNSRGYTNFKTRKVIVVNDSASINVSHIHSPIGMTNNRVTYAFDISGDDYYYSVLPNGSMQTEKAFMYQFTENGTYTLKVYDKLERVKEVIISVDNIDKTPPNGTCTATYNTNNTTTIEVSALSDKVISNYEYIIDGKTASKSSSIKYVSSIKKPSIVSVKMTDSINNTNVINCLIIDKSVPEIYVNADGKNCLEGYTCFIQGKYNNPDAYYCSASADTGCGTIAQRGCSVTSMATALSKWNFRSKNGEIYNPETLTNEVYHQVCPYKQYYSGDTCFRNVAEYFSLTTSKTLSFSRENYDILKSYLRQGYPVIIQASKGAYTDGGHLMAILGINNNDEVYLFQTGKAETNSMWRDYKVNTWVPIDQLRTGGVNDFRAIINKGVTP